MSCLLVQPGKCPGAAQRCPALRTIRSVNDQKVLHGAVCCAVLSCLSRVPLSATSWTRAHQAPLSMGFSRQEYWSGLPCPPPGDLPDPGIEPASSVAPALQADSLLLSLQGRLIGSGLEITFNVN